MKPWLVAFLCSSAFIYANDCAPTPPKPSPCDRPARSCPKPVPADADLFRRDAPAFSFHGSFLFWRVQEGDIDYVLKQQHTPPGGTSYAQGKLEKASYDGEPGFRIALSYFRAPKYWEIWGEYTRLTARGSDHTDASSDPTLFLNSTWPDIITRPITSARSGLHFNYNVADLLVDRFFNPNPHLRLRLLGGATVAWMNQDFYISYTNALSEMNKVHAAWKFIGGGLRLGTTIDWFCGYDIYLTARATAVTLLGSYHNEARQVVSTTAQPVRDMHFSDVRPALGVQGMFGPSWQHSFCASRMELFVGYEINTWLNLQEIYRSTGSTASAAKETWINSSALALQGLTTRLTWDF